MALIAKTTTALLIGCTLLCCTESTATAHDAESVFRRCVSRLDEINDRVTNAQAQTVHECVPRIKRLLAGGEVEEARHVARRCHNRLDHLTEAGISALRDTCQVCVEALRKLGAYGLAHRLSHICREHAEQLVKHNRRAKNIIIGLF